MGAGLVGKCCTSWCVIQRTFDILVAQEQRNLGPTMLVYGQRNEITSSISSSSDVHWMNNYIYIYIYIYIYNIIIIRILHNTVLFIIHACVKQASHLQFLQSGELTESPSSVSWNAVEGDLLLFTELHPQMCSSALRQIASGRIRSLTVGALRCSLHSRPRPLPAHLQQRKT